MSDGSREQFSAVAGGSTEPTRGSVSAATVLKHNPALLSDEVLERTFAARGPLLADLVERVRQNSGRDSAQHYLLIGPRGSGKTTLLRLLAIRIRQDADLSRQWLPVLFAEEEPSIYDVEDFLLTILERMAPAVPEAGRVRSEVMAFSLEDRQHGADLALVALEEVAKEAGRRLLLLVDNLDQILGRTTAGDELATRRLRSTFQHSPILMLVGSSTAIFEELIDYRRPLYQFFAPIHLAPLTYAQVLELLRRRAAVDGNNLFLRPTRELRIKVRVVTEITGGNPRLVVALYDLLSGSPMIGDVDALMRLLDELTPYYKARLEELPSQQRKLLDLIVRAGGAAGPSELASRSGLQPNLVSSQLRRLREASWLRLRRGPDRRSARYAVADQLMRYWYQMRYLSDQRHRFSFLVSFYRDLYVADELRSLQSGLLAHLESIVGQPGRAARIAEHALIVQEVSTRLIAIEEALPPTAQRDPDRWRHAQILREAGDLEQALLVLRLSRDRHVAAADAAAEATDELMMGECISEAGRLSAALDHYSRSVAIYRQLATIASKAYEPDLAMALNNLGAALGRLRRPEEAEQCLREAETILRRLADGHPGVLDPDLAMALGNLGNALGDLGQPQEAETVYREAERTYRQLAGEQPERYAAKLAMILGNLGAALLGLARPQEAEDVAREAERIYRHLAEQQPHRYQPGLAGSLNNLGNALADLDRPEDAERVYREAERIYRRLAEKQPERYEPDLAMALNNRGLALRTLARSQEAESLLREAERTYRHLAEQHPQRYQPDLAGSLNSLGAVLVDLKQLTDGEGAFREAERVYRRLAEQQPERYEPDMAMALSNLGATLVELERPEEAERAFREAEQTYRRLAEQRPGRYEPHVATALSNLGAVLDRLRRPEEAASCLREAESIRRRLIEQLRHLHGAYVQAAGKLWYVLQAQGKLDEAESVLRRAVQVAECASSMFQEDFRTGLALLFEATLPRLLSNADDAVLAARTSNLLEVLGPLDPNGRGPLWFGYLQTALRSGVSESAFESMLAQIAQRLPESSDLMQVFRLAYQVRHGRDAGMLASADEDVRRAVEALIAIVQQPSGPDEDSVTTEVPEA